MDDTLTVKENLEAIFSVLDGRARGSKVWWAEKLDVNESTVHRWITKNRIPRKYHERIGELKAQARQKVVEAAKGQLGALQ